MDLSFKHLSYAVTTRKGDAKAILQDVTGYCQAGRLLALMGRSGAGKTTLLDVLACQLRGGMLTGEVLVNGQQREAAAFKRSSCYVMQQDVLLHTATVREALTTSALLRLPRSTPRASIKARVDALIQELGLLQCTDTLIGSEALGMKGISGGERRRVSMGLELVTQPAVVFLDEPTSGLDSDTALSVVYLLRRLATRNRTVVCTIHQPSSDIVECFQDLLLLASGRLCFCGPWVDALPFLADAGFPCPMYKNPADFFMTLTGISKNVDALSRSISKQVDAGQLPPPNGWPQTPPLDLSSDALPGDDCNVDIQQLPGGASSDAPDGARPPAPAPDLPPDGATSRPPAWYQTWVLSVRFFRSWRRDPMLLASEAFQYAFFGLSLGLMYLRLSSSLPKAPFNRASALWFSLACMCFTPSMTAVVSWDSERPLLRREASAGAYSPAAFYLAKTVVTLPFEAALTSVFVIISYFMIGLQARLSKFLVHLAVLVLFQLCSETVGLLCAVASRAAAYAIILLSVVLIYLLSFSGFLLNEVPVYFRWIPKVSYLNYAYVAVMKNELYGLQLTDPSDGSRVMAQSLFPQASDNGLGIWENIAVLAAMAVGMRLLGLCLLLLVARLRML